MIRMQVQLTEEQARALRNLASARQVSVTELIRQSVDTLIRSSGAIDAEERRRRAIAAAGRFHSEAPDISTKHDEYLFADTCLNPCARLFYGQRLEGEK